MKQGHLLAKKCGNSALATGNSLSPIASLHDSCVSLKEVCLKTKCENPGCAIKMLVRSILLLYNLLDYFCLLESLLTVKCM